MTEQEWLASTNPAAMLRWIEDGRRYHDGRGQVHAHYVSDRKLRLFACACKLASGTNVAHTAYAEMLANDGGPPTRLSEFDDPKRLAEIWCVRDGIETAMMRTFGVRVPTKPERADLLRHIVGNPWRPMRIPKYQAIPGESPERWADPRKAAKIYQEIGKPSWQTPLVLDLAQQLYDGRDVGPILHDALIDAGAPEELVGHFAEPCPHCKDAKFEVGDFGKRMPSQLAKHLRKKCACKGTQLKYDTHPKGCWALDLILGKE